MSKVKLELNHSGIESILNSSGIEGLLESIGSNIANRAGEGYEAEIVQSKDRRHSGSRLKCFVRTATFDAAVDNHKNNSLLKAM